MPSRYLELTVAEFLERLSAPEPGPGGGSVAALTLAQAAALVTMVSRRSRGSWSGAAGAGAQARALRRRAIDLVESDAEAWADALAALESPDRALEEKLGRAAEVPLQIGDLAADVASLAALVAERCEGTYRGDAATAALLAHASARAAEKLVAINLAIGPSDDRRERASAAAAAAAAAAARALESGP
jgi:formiminotetrahydrofolate cyclodeaminase